MKAAWKEVPEVHCILSAAGKEGGSVTIFDMETDHTIFQSRNGRRRSSAYVFRELMLVVSELKLRLDRPPASHEIAAAMGVRVDQYFSLLEEVYLLFTVYNQSPSKEKKTVHQHLHVLLDDHVVDIASTRSANGMTGDRKIDQLARAIEGLPEQERYIITLQFFEDMNVEEVCKVLNLSELLYSRLFIQAMLRLSSDMKKSHLE